MVQRFTAGKDPATPVGAYRGLFEAIEWYFRWKKMEGHTRATIEGGRKHLEYFTKWLAGAFELVEALRIDLLTPMTIFAYLEHLHDRVEAETMAPQTHLTRYRVLAAFFNWCVDWDYLEETPMRRFKPPRIPVVYKEFMTPEEFRALLDLCPPVSFTSARRRAMLMMFKATGMRRGEMADLLVEDLHWGPDGFVVIRMGKGRKPRSTFWSNMRVQRDTMRYLKFRNSDRPELWLNEKQRPLTANGISTEMARLMERAGVTIRDRCHVFRRGFIADLPADLDLDYRLHVTGHTTLAMSMHYTRAKQLQSGKAIEALNAKCFDPFKDIF